MTEGGHPFSSDELVRLPPSGRKRTFSCNAAAAFGSFPDVRR